MPTLYTFKGSVWASVPDLAIHELGYSEDAIEIEEISLARAQNFEPEFLKVNPKATLPTLVDGDQVYTSTKDVTDYLIKHAPKPAGKPSGSDLVQLLHGDSLDPNFARMSVQNEEELKAKAASPLADFIRIRQAKLEEVAPANPEFKSFYDAKMAQNGFIASVFEGTAPEQSKEAIFAKSQKLWSDISTFLSSTLPKYLPANGGFIGGENASEDDFHLGAWLARIGAIAHASNDASGIDAIGKKVGVTVADPVKAYWAWWVSRPSWSQVYTKGLH